MHYGAASERESLATITRMLELGITFFDTGEVYGPFANEELLGRALKRRFWTSISCSSFAISCRKGEMWRVSARLTTLKESLLKMPPGGDEAAFDRQPAKLRRVRL